MDMYKISLQNNTVEYHGEFLSIIESFNSVPLKLPQAQRRAVQQQKEGECVRVDLGRSHDATHDSAHNAARDHVLTDLVQLGHRRVWRERLPHAPALGSADDTFFFCIRGKKQAGIQLTK